MNRAEKSVLIVYSLLWTLGATFGFGIVRPDSTAINYVLIILLYIIPITAICYGLLSTPSKLGLLVATPLLPSLLVLDPVELGLYGHDPYIHTLPALSQFQHGAISQMLSELSFPGMYAFYSAMEAVLGLGPNPLAKYIPLLSLTAIPIIYLAFRRVYADRVAFVAATLFSSVRLIYLFEIKFIDEFLAVPLFAVVLLVLFTLGDRRQRYLLLLFLLVLVLTHHVFSLLLLLILGFWLFIPLLLQKQPLRRLQPTSKPPKLFLPTSLASLLLCWLLIWGGSQTTSGLVVYLVKGLIMGDTLAVKGGVSSPVLTQLKLISRMSILAIAGLCLLVAYRVLNRRSQSDWVLGWSAAAGVIGGVYAVTLFAGRLIPLDPGRLLIHWFFLLIGVATPVLWLKKPKRHYVVILASIFIVATQLAAIPPVVMYSDIDTTTTGEGHYTPAQFEASAWAGQYTDGPIIAYESGLWVSNGIEFISYTNNEFADCQLKSWRKESGDPRPMNESIVFDSNDIALQTCR
ncbi:hypothetical protein [Haloarcula sp. CBA1127]|uniref:hypothetical protein n=1 Tax=Haloarcula sp. CBA1127 TaxID=1765055 RepID=UPI00073EF578|nr:hypothetical protein [Haloarcula sp. CBA1127]